MRAFQDQFAARRIEIENRIPDSLPPLRVDKPKFCRLFELLFKEELAMLPAGCRITLSAELQHEGKPEIVVQITDNGPGLPEDALRAVLDPFAAQRQRAVRIWHSPDGLFFYRASSWRKNRSHSQPGSGTTLTLYLPLQPEPAAPTGDTVFLKKALLNENLWGNLIATG